VREVLQNYARVITSTAADFKAFIEDVLINFEFYADDRFDGTD